MNDPTTNPQPFVEPYTRAVARIITAALAARQPTGDPVADTTVTRAEIRRAWYVRYPEHGRREPNETRRAGTPRINGALRDLDRRGVLERAKETVRVLDTTKLKQVSESVDNHQDRNRRRDR